MRIVKIDNEADFKWLANYINNWDIKCKDNWSAYIEYADMFARLNEVFSNSEKIKDPADDGPAPAKTRAPRGSVKNLKPNYCKDHPTYGAKRKPRGECESCWKAFAKFNPLSPHLRKRKAT